ncbi:MAG: D-tyrosyl-tRNA(Tyr) deacylase [Candidatus Hydrogenedentes bacterium]|nr:D-tyrosyl-tRNA(Tyr) deacylase [Candidatus Hydrogenedentota bacterium]
MRAVVQRVRHASVRVDEEIVGAIGHGLLVLLGVDVSDGNSDADYLADKIFGLRIFNDDDGKFNRSLEDVGGAVLLVSQFTLHGDCRKGRRPSFIAAARPEQAIPLYERVGSLLREKGVEVANGIFGAHMAVELLNDGPVTLLLDSGKAF